MFNFLQWSLFLKTPLHGEALRINFNITQADAMVMKKHFKNSFQCFMEGFIFGSAFFYFGWRKFGFKVKYLGPIGMLSTGCYCGQKLVTAMITQEFVLDILSTPPIYSPCTAICCDALILKYPNTPLTDELRKRRLMNNIHLLRSGYGVPSSLKNPLFKDPKVDNIASNQSRRFKGV